MSKFCMQKAGDQIFVPFGLHFALSFSPQFGPAFIARFPKLSLVIIHSIHPMLKTYAHTTLLIVVRKLPSLSIPLLASIVRAYMLHHLFCLHLHLHVHPSHICSLTFDLLRTSAWEKAIRVSGFEAFLVHSSYPMHKITTVL